MDRNADRRELIERASSVDNVHDECPFDDCDGTIKCTSMHERDSSNDRYACNRCGWSYSQLELWSLE